MHSSKQIENCQDTYKRKEDELFNLKHELEKKHNLFTKSAGDKTNPIKLLSMGYENESNEAIFKNSKLYENLHQEIEFFYEEHEEYIANNMSLITQIITEIDNIVKEIYPEIAFRPYGSFAMGLHMPWSDIDLLAILPRDPNAEPIDLLAKIEALLSVI